MTQHTDLIDRLRKGQTHDYSTGALRDMSSVMDDAAEALEAQAREIEALKAQLSATAKNAFEAMPHDIPKRMKNAICEETGWSGSLVSRAYTELRKAFTGEPYKANEDLDAALLEIERLRKDAERWAMAARVTKSELCTLYGMAQAECKKLREEVEGLRKDAERYRFLRIQPDDCSAPRIDICRWTCEDGDNVNQGDGLRGVAADEAIDAAMKGQP